MKKYTALFFDLDHTLWDYDTNSTETLHEVFDNFNIAQRTEANKEQFVSVFNTVNDKLWANFNKGHIDRDVIKKQRFDKILKHFGIKDQDLSQQMSKEYIELCPTKTGLMPHAVEVLEYLHKKYPLYLLTNGFNEVQESKIASAKIGHYFKDMVTSETSGHRKPSIEIFQYTLNLASTMANSTVMIGDNLAADIHGAKNALLDTIYYNPKKTKHKSETDHEVSCLSQLTNIL
jgi:YjjG family noncanonical pyrimidine nucleotidase